MVFEVYIHVPFCLRRCGYCDFNTYTATDLGAGASRGNYAAMVMREMRLVRDWQERHGVAEPPASSVFFGGGTPTVLPAADLVAMLDEARRTWGIAPDAEITTEANPDTVDADYVARLADGGFTRISFGMQSAVPHVLATLDRTHTPANVEAGVRAAEAAGLRSSVDLIYGAPGESLDDWRTSVQMAIDLGVDHCSAYALTVEPSTTMGRRIAAGTLPKPDDDDEAAKYELADELFDRAGLTWYEISNWARPGYESRHNLGYWRNVDWAGLGPGAHSHYAAVRRRSARTQDSPDLPDMRASSGVRDARESSEVQDVRDARESQNPLDVLRPDEANPSGSTSGLRSWDIAHPKLWAMQLNAGHVPWADCESITRDEALEETIMLGLRLREGLDLTTLPVDADRGGIAELEHDGLVERRGDRLVPTLRGRLLNDTVIERMFAICGL